jgi:hypothetical protein
MTVPGCKGVVKSEITERQAAAYNKPAHEKAQQATADVVPDLAG